MAQQAVGERPLADSDLVDLAGDRDHRRAEAIELGERLALGRLIINVPATGKLIVGAWKP